MFTVEELNLILECIGVMQGEYPFENTDSLNSLYDKTQSMIDEK